MKTAIGYFPHDFNSRNDDRILELREKHGPSGYAFFFMLCEIMAENDDGSLDLDRVGGYSISMAITKDDLLGFIDDCIRLKLLVPGSAANKLTSQRMQSHKQSREAMSKGARNRAAKQATQTPAPIVKPTRVPLLETDGSPRQQLEQNNAITLETFKVQFKADLNKVNATWEEVLDKWSTSMMATNDDYPTDDQQRYKQLQSTLRRYILSWISNGTNKTKTSTSTLERELRG